jgi:outer membrane receptor for ferrienterochelin and colicins
MKRAGGGALCAFLIATRLAAAQGTQDQGPPANLPSELAQLSLEELADVKIDSVYGASLFLQKVTEAPSSVTIISADHIQKYGHRTLAEVLRSVRGFYVTNDRNYSFLGVRGFSRPGDYNARVLLLVDGHRLNDNIFGSALIGTEFPLDIDLIERIEIIRGPSSSLYGTSAFFGVINVITKNGGSINGFDVSGAAGSFESRKGRVTFGQTFRNAELLLSASAYDSKGERRVFFEEFAAPDTNGGFAENADDDEFGQLFGKVRVGNFTFQGLFGSRDKTVPTASFGTVFNDPRSRTVENQGFLDLRYRTPLFSGWDLDSRLHYDGYGYDGDYVFEHSVDNITDTVVNKDFARGNWWGADVTATRKFANRHTLALGSEYRDNVRQDQFNYDDLATSFYHLDDRRSSTNWAVYAQDEIALHRKLRLNVGLRHDSYDTFGETTNPRAAVIYNPVDTTTVKVLYGAAFRAPNAYELFWQQSGIGKANPALQPETNRTSEVVLERYLGRHLRVTGTGFYYTVKGLITQQTDAVDSLLVYKNVEAIKAHGLELELDGNWPSGLEGRVSYAYQDSRNQTTRLPLTNSPGHVAHFNLITPLVARNVFAGFGVRYISERRTIAGDTVAPAFVPSITVSSRRLGKGMELAASVHNLLGSKYRDPGSEEHRQDSIVQIGRTVRFKLTYKFPSVR